MLLMRSLAAEMRQSPHGLTPMHVGLLAKIDAGEFTLSDLAHHQSVRLPTISKSICTKMMAMRFVACTWR